MKLIYFFSAASLAALLLFTGCASSSVTPEPMTITVERVKGNAVYSDGENWHLLKPGDRVMRGVTIKTTASSILDLAFDKPIERRDEGPRTKMVSIYHTDRQCLRVFENTDLKITRAEKVDGWESEHWHQNQNVEDIQLELRAGIILGNTGPMTPKAKYEIALPNGHIGLSGNAAYRVNVSNDVQVLNGTASVFLANKNTTRQISSGNSFNLVTQAIRPLSRDEITLMRRFVAATGPEFEYVTAPPAKPAAGLLGSLRKF